MHFEHNHLDHLAEETEPSWTSGPSRPPRPLGTPGPPRPLDLMGSQDELQVIPTLV